MSRILSLIFLIGIFSCNRQPKLSSKKELNLDSLSTIYIDNSNIEGHLRLDSIIDTNSVKFIPLETADSTLVAYVGNCFAIDSGFLIVDPSTNKILHFDKSGKFIKKIGAYGKGPEEYQNILDVKYNKYHHTIDVSDISLRMLSYNVTTGNVKNIDDEIIRKHNAVMFLPKEENSYVLYNNFASIEQAYENYRIYYVKDGNVVYQDLPFDSSIFSNVAITRQFYNYDVYDRFFEPFFPVVYTIEDNGLTPVYHIEFEMNNTIIKNANDITNILKEGSVKKLPLINSIQESDSYFFLNFAEGGYRRYSIFDKENKRSFGTATLGFLMPEIGLEIGNELFKVDNNEFVTSVSAKQILEIQDRLKDKEELSPLENKVMSMKIDEFDNYILVYFKTS